MHAHDVCAALDRDHRCGYARINATIQLPTGNAPEHALARNACQYGRADTAEVCELTQQREIMLQRLAEAKTRIDNDAIVSDTCLVHCLYPHVQECKHLRDDIVIRPMGREGPVRKVFAAVAGGAFRSPATEAMLEILKDVAADYAAERRPLAKVS